MSTTTLEAAPPAPPARQRRRWVRVAVVVGLVAVVAAVVTAVLRDRYASNYDALREGGAGGPVGNQSVWRSHDTDLGFYHYLAGPTGTTGRWFFVLDNSGDEDVHVTGISAPNLVGAVASDYVVVNGGSTSGEPRPFHALPTTIPAHHQARIVLTFRHLACNGNSVFDSVQVEWNALGHDHTTPMQPFGGGWFVDCPTHPND